MFDNGILQLIKSNENAGMARLIEQYTPLVYSIVSGRLSSFCSSEDIEETVSDVFITFYKKKDTVDLSKGRLSAYLAGIAKNKALDRLRRLNKQNEIRLDDDDCFIEIPDKFNLESSIERQELYKRLIKEIKALGEPDCTILYRKYYLCEGSEEIAAATGLTSDNVRKRASRALRKIELNMKGEHYEN